MTPNRTTTTPDLPPLPFQPIGDDARRSRAGWKPLSSAAPVRLLLFLCFLFSAQALAEQRLLFAGVSASQPPVVTVSTAWSADGLRPGGTIDLAVILAVAPGYHINADERQLGSISGFRPLPTRVQAIQLPPGLAVGSVEYPPAHAVQLSFSEEKLMVLDGRVGIRLRLQADPDTVPARYEVTVQVSYQACDDQSCLLPRKEDRTIALTVVEAGAPVSETPLDVFEEMGPGTAGTAATESVAFDLFGWTFSVGVGSGAGRLLLLLTAALGGILLNFTPCVLPLVPIKIMSLSSAADQNRIRCLLLGATTFSGVLVFWLFLGVLVAGVADFTATNQLFQYPAFTLSVGAIIAVMAAGMFGTYSMRLPDFLYRFHPDQESLIGSFALGILTAVLSTPCTAPFMGAAAAWAVTQPPATTLATFAAIGTGMAFPYLLLSARPELVRRLPRSGPASVLIKEMMGWFLLAAAAYFLGSGISALAVQAPESPSRSYWWVVAGLTAGSGVWLAFRTFRITRKTGYRVASVAFGFLLVTASLAGGWRLTEPGTAQWVSYTPQRLEQARARGQVVVLVFTAEWCLNCKALEQSVLRDPDVEDLLLRDDVVPMRADITGDNPDGKRKLAELGSVTIPLLAVIAPGGTVVFRSDFYTAEQLIRAVQEELGSSGR